MKKHKYLLIASVSAVISLLIAAAIFSLGISAGTDGTDGTNENKIVSGSCGTGVSWTFYPECGELWISGSGNMTSYSKSKTSKRPDFENLKDDITTVVICDDVKSIGNYTFYNYTAITTLYVGKSVTSINKSAFSGCSALKTVYLNSLVLETIGENAFEGCNALASEDGATYFCGDEDAFDKIGDYLDESGNLHAHIHYYQNENCKLTGEETLSYPSLAKPGIKVKICKTNKHTCRVAEIIPALTEITGNFSVSCSVHDNFALNYYFPSASFVGCDSVYLELCSDESGENVIETINDYSAADGQLKFTYSNIPAPEVSKPLFARIAAKVGDKTVKGGVFKYSVKQYAYDELKSTSDSSLKTLLVDMLNYCAAAEEYFGSGYGRANSDLTDEMKAFASTGMPEASALSQDTENKDADITLYAKSVVFASSPELKFYFRVKDGSDAGALTLVAEYKTSKGEDIKRSIPLEKSGELYSAKLDGINMCDIFSEVSVTVCGEDDKPLGNTSHYSVEAYAHKLIGSDNSDDKYNKLLEALLKFGASAKGYFNK